MIKNRPTWMLACFAVFLSGCTINQSIGDSFGSAVRKPHGQEFSPVTEWDKSEQALLYVYRPATQWSNDEFESPSFNVNGKRIFNIKGGSYTWYLLEPGMHDIVMRRGVLGFEGVNNYNLSTITEMHLEAVAGKTFYLRYSEQDAADNSENALISGPLQSVSSTLALEELKQTKLLHRSGKLLASRAITDEDNEPEVAPVAVAPVVEAKPVAKAVEPEKMPVAPVPMIVPKAEPKPKPVVAPVAARIAAPTPAPAPAPVAKAPASKPNPVVFEPPVDDGFESSSFEGSMRIIEPTESKKPWWKFW